MASKLFNPPIPGMAKPVLYKWLEAAFRLWRTIDQYEEDLTPTSVNSNQTSVQTFTVNGVDLGDQIIAVEPPTDISPNNITCYRVTAADTVELYFHNGSGGSDTPDSGNYKFAVLKYRGQ